MTVPASIEYIAVGVSALTGVLAARGRDVDLFGVLVLAVVTAFGGGTLRDLMVGDTPVFWLRSSAYLYTAFGVGLVSFFAFRSRGPHAVLLAVADAFALALFNVVGARKGLALGFDSSVAVLLGIVTGVAGGILRDVLVGQVPVVFRPTTPLYATAAAAGGVVYAALLRGGHWSADAAEFSGVAVCLLIRLGALRFQLRLPSFDPATQPPPRS
jgi:uncharacterized membrane protein YeiH